MVEKITKVIDGAINNNSFVAKILRYVILVGWLVAASLFWMGADQIIQGQRDLSAKITEICIELSSYSEWKRSIDSNHLRLERRLDRLEDNLSKLKE